MLVAVAVALAVVLVVMGVICVKAAGKKKQAEGQQPLLGAEGN